MIRNPDATLGIQVRPTPRHGSELQLTPTVPPDSKVVAQLIVYRTAEPTVYEGSAITSKTGPIEIIVPIDQPPPSGTTVQVVLYTSKRPAVYEGTTTLPGPDGSFGIILRAD